MHGYKGGEGGRDVPDIVKFILFSVVPIIQDMLLVLLFFRGMVLRQKRKDSRYDLLVSLRPVLLWAGAVCGGMLSVPVTLLGPDDMSSGVWVLFEVVVLACIAMMLAYCNETVTYDKSEFHTRNLFGIERSYDYGEITGISRKGGDTVLRCGRRRIRLDSMSFGGNEFVAYADKAYFRQYKRYIPVFKPKKDPLNGNLDTPWLYLVVYVFILAGGIFMSILSVSGLRPAKDELPADAVELRTVFSSYERTKKDSGTLVLYAPGYDKPFSISWLSGYRDHAPDPDTLCNGEDYILSVREGKQEYWIHAISTADHRSILSAYDCNTAYRNTQYVACILLLLIAMPSFTFGLFGILVGRHPERYSRRFRRLFYKDSAWVSPDWKKHKHPPKRRQK